VQTVTAAFTAEERDTDRKIVQSTQIAWKKSYKNTIVFFTIGVSTIGGTDLIPSADSSPSQWNYYQYDNDSSYVTGLAYERELQEPTGGLTAGMAEAQFNNTDGRYTPRTFGGSSAIFTAVEKPGRPFVINAGFNYSGIDNSIPQFVGLTDRPPKIDMRGRTTAIQGTDFVGFLQNQYVDNTAMFTGQRTDQIIASTLATLGFSTAQYELDTGINIVPFAEITAGNKFGPFIHKLVQAENGNFYQDETGKLRFQNRQAWNNAPYNTVQRIISTGQVIQQSNPNYDHLINVVEVVSKPRAKQALQIIHNSTPGNLIKANSTLELFLSYDDPILQVTSPTSGGANSYYLTNSLADGTGTDLTANVSIKSISNFAKASKVVFQNNSSSSDCYLSKLVISGRPAKITDDIYIRQQDDSSVTAYAEHPFKIDNEYIGSQDWANSYAQMILGDYSEPNKLQNITIRAIPELQFGDMISWQGRYWRIYGIKTKLDDSTGYVQELKLVQKIIVNYFRIGFSTIGGTDQIAP